MPAIITDQLRISNAKSFVEKVSSNSASYYSFIGLSNPEEIKSDWDQFPPAPKDSFSEETNYWDTMISLNRITSGNVRQVIRKIEWNSGDIYDMYRHDITRDIIPIDKRSKPSNSTSLYLSNFYVINSDFRVYICLYNGATPENNFQGVPSLDEPTFTDLDPRPAGTSGDGYIWKYLYTIKPSEIIKFDSIDYIPVPRNWGQEGESINIKNHALNSDQIKICTIRNRGRGLGEPRVINKVNIVGDGVGTPGGQDINATASVVIGNDSRVESIQVTNGGTGYTFASIDWKSAGISTLEEEPEFDVIIPPQGGHGFDIYRELGAYYVLLFSRFENDTNNPDFITGNKISRIGLIENPLQFDTQDILDESYPTASAVFALKLKGISPNDNDFKTTTFSRNSFITQTIETGVTAVGRVISYDQETGVLKYWQDRSLVGFKYDGTNDRNPQYGLKLNLFTDSPTGLGNLRIQGGSRELEIDVNFGTKQNPKSVDINNINLGQSFVKGISKPEVQKYSGNIIYVDNRPSILRSINQKEDIKIVLQF
jgi:hypothetical protein